MTREKLKVIYDDLSSSGFIEVREIPKPQRILAGLKVWLICFVIAIFCVLIPLLHFILVPGMLILSFVLGYSAYTNKFETLDGAISCPSCKATSSIKNQSYGFPKAFRCPSCSITLNLDLD